MRRRAGKHKPYPLTEPARLTPMMRYALERITKMRRAALRKLVADEQTLVRAAEKRERRRTRANGSSS